MTQTTLRPGRSYCAEVSSNACEAPAGVRTGTGHAGLPGVRREDLGTCGYCGEPVCSECSTPMDPPAFSRKRTPVPVCSSHDEESLAIWLGLDGAR